MWVDTFRLVGVARQFRSVRPPDAGLVIQRLAFGAGRPALLPPAAQKCISYSLRPASKALRLPQLHSRAVILLVPAAPLSLMSMR